ncbi:MAG TPA: histidine kinase [Burkholderiaceae bacterium]|nr:histidine kinase [Burkholderiaceae bacterium]
MNTASPSEPTPPIPPKKTWGERVSPLVRAFHVYATWLVSISWKRFFLLSLLLLLIAAILKDIPPFSWTISENVHTLPTKVVIKPPPPPAPPQTPQKGAAEHKPSIRIETPNKKGEPIEISIGEQGVRIVPRGGSDPSGANEAAAAAASAAAAADRAARQLQDTGITITLPPGAAADEVRRAIDEARETIRQAVEEARADAEQARRDAEEARREAEAAAADIVREAESFQTRITRTSIGDFLPNLAFLWIFCSMIIKITYKKQLSAQQQAAQATEVAESEQLKRQVVEARMAAMQAQVEPHFLFNTLASIDHLIETDPPRASTMQKNLIALLRASMPTMREANSNGAPRDLAREMAVIRPYLEILKVRMEERLATRIEVPDGLLSAEFPPMMIQSLVENAIKHGLEPKAEGGELLIKAEIVHGKLAITVADTGLGFGKAATAGTGVGLANIRERLQLLYGSAASLTVAENQPGGTRVTVAVPYRTVDAAAAKTATA